MSHLLSERFLNGFSQLPLKPGIKPINHVFESFQLPFYSKFCVFPWRKPFLSIFLIFFTVTAFSQNVGIGTHTPNPAAQLEVSSTSRGFLPPRMTFAQRNAISNPVAGLVVFCTDCGAKGQLQTFDGDTWLSMVSGPASIPFTPPVLTTSAVSAITVSGALSGGSISSDGGAAVTARGVVWGTSANPTVALATKTSDGTGIGTFTSTISALSPGTTYFLRAYATNSVGTAYGNEISFTTTSTIPTLTTAAVSSISASGAVSGGAVSATGGAPVTARGVVWSTNPNPTVALATKTSDGTGTGSFTSTISGLSPGITYYVRAYATNSVGTAYGNEISFTTSTTVPAITTTAISSVTSTGAAGGGNITSDGGSAVTARGIVWSTTTGPTVALATKTSDGTGTGSFTSTIAGLSPGITYYVRAYATNSLGTAYGNEVSFTTSTTVPAITTAAITSITATGAAGGGNITSDGGSVVTARGIVWSTTTGPTVALATKTSDGTGTGSFTSTLAGLAPGTTYFVRAYATNSTGTAYGNEVSFTTSSSLPVLTTATVTAITSTGASGGGNITSNGGAAITARGVVWSTSSNPTVALTTKTSDGSGSGSFTSTITGLVPGTTYFIRAYATNSAGTAYGNELSFTTTGGGGSHLNQSLTYGNLNDIDGNTYKTIQIGTQTWMAENLRVTKYRNGTAITNVTDQAQWQNATTGAWCYQKNDAGNNIPYGKLYNGFAVTNPNNLCPDGWRVPSDADWATLETFLGGAAVAGGKMKTTGTTFWVAPNQDASNSSGFSGLGGGARTLDFALFGTDGDWWSASLSGADGRWRYITTYGGDISTATGPRFYGLSVRCVKDAGSIPAITTQAISGITANTAVGGGNTTSDGGSAVTARGIVWSTTTGPTVALATKTSDGTGTGSFTSNISGLMPGTTYYVRAYATNSAGTAYGNEVSFNTTALSLPVLTTHPISAITESAASSGGNISSDGGAAITSRGVVWATTSNPTVALSTKTSDGTGTGNFSSTLKGLSPNTTYYVRAYATNIAGTAYGVQQTFTTQPAPSYTNVGIGSQVWMNKNLDVIRYRNGDLIPQVSDPVQWAALTSGAWCWFNNDSAAYAATYGRLYNWHAVNDPRGLAPEGWHIPADVEWDTLINFLGGASVAGGKMREAGTARWQAPNDGASNTSGFTALPAGFRGSASDFGNITTAAYWWSTTESTSTRAWGRFLNNTGTSIGRGSLTKGNGFSIRCVKDGTNQGTISSINCAAATNNGTLTSGTAASSVNSVISYTGGNAGSHNGQSVVSTGVTGLTAMLAPGTFANGSGTLMYTIAGTPASSGTASFALNIGGQTCTLTRTVNAPAGSITAINCAGATNNGTLTSGTAASSVSSVVPYTGGNGGSHSGQTVTSTGVTGLTATLAAGAFANGSGSLTYNITGTPSGSGTASFALNIGGQTCSLTRLVDPPAGSITAINCAGATNNGTLTSGTAASSVSSVVPYTGGNGGSHNGQTVTSTGVTGLTATLAAGTFANGAGSLTYNITGTPSGSGTASFALNIGGQTCTLTRTVSAPVSYPAGTVHCSGTPTAVADVTNPLTGQTWMDRNLGAARVATSFDDASAYGDLYQWGRRADGHQCRNSATTSTLSSSDQPANGNFILSNSGAQDWRNPLNDNLWQGVNGTNNPCPAGYRIPTEAELNAERSSWSTKDFTGAYGSPLKMTITGSRNALTGTLESTGGTGGAASSYWSSTVSGTYSKYLGFTVLQAALSFGQRASGYAVRCIKETGTVLGAISTINCGGATNSGTLTSGTAASSVSSVVPYTGGNGGSHSGQTVTSTGVTGLTATLAAGTFANGSGSLTYNITGTPLGSGTASFALNIGGQICTLTRIVNAVVSLPVLTTADISSITATTASGGGTITSDGGAPVTARGIVWSTAANPTVSLTTKTSDGTGTGAFTSLLTGLSPQTTYYVRAYATNSAGTAYGNERSFTSGTLEPLAFVTGIRNILSTSATIDYTVQGGSAPVTERGLKWIKDDFYTGSPWDAWNSGNDGTGAGNFSTTITGLAPGTLYIVKAYAKNSFGTGEQVMLDKFTTAPALPTLTTTSVSDITSNSAASGGDITSDGGAEIIEQGIVWSTSANPTLTLSNKIIYLYPGRGSFTSNITGLPAATTYYVRAYATNSVGTAYGNEISFTTLVAAQFNPNLTYGSLTDIDGNVYKTIQIGTQTWMAENLRVTKYRNGTSILNITDNTQWSNNNSVGAWAYYNNDASYNLTYGKLYNWWAVSNPNNLCPTGWHIPSDAEWTTLGNFIGWTGAGGKLKSTGTQFWMGPNTGANNSTGFSAIPGGYRSPTGPSYNIRLQSSIWTSTSVDANLKISWYMVHNDNILGKISGSSTMDALSVRCVKD